MTPRHWMVAAALAAFAAAPMAQTASRIGFINTDRMLREAQSAKTAQTRLEQEFSRREREINSAAESLRAESERFEREAPTMGDSQRQTQQRRLLERDRDLQRRRREFQEDLNARKQEELQQILDRANRIVKQVAEEGKYDVILQEAVYINPALDITDQVIRALNASK